MASQVFSGTDQQSFTYTNNTGQNVRIIINYLRIALGSAGANPGNCKITAGNLVFPTVQSTNNFNIIRLVIGRNLAFTQYATNDTGLITTISSNNAYISQFDNLENEVALATELMISSGQVFSIVATPRGGTSGSVSIQSAAFSYNFVIIPENG